MVKILCVGSSEHTVLSSRDIDIALRLQKQPGATGRLTFQLLNRENEILTNQVVLVNSLEAGTHWYKFRSNISRGFCCYWSKIQNPHKVFA